MSSVPAQRSVPSLFQLAARSIRSLEEIKGLPEDVICDFLESKSFDYHELMSELERDERIAQLARDCVQSIEADVNSWDEALELASWPQLRILSIDLETTSIEPLSSLIRTWYQAARAPRMLLSITVGTASLELTLELEPDRLKIDEPNLEVVDIIGPELQTDIREALSEYLEWHRPESLIVDVKADVFYGLLIDLFDELEEPIRIPRLSAPPEVDLDIVLLLARTIQAEEVSPSQDPAVEDVENALNIRGADTPLAVVAWASTKGDSIENLVDETWPLPSIRRWLLPIYEANIERLRQIFPNLEQVRRIAIQDDLVDLA